MKTTTSNVEVTETDLRLLTSLKRNVEYHNAQTNPYLKFSLTDAENLGECLQLYRTCYNLMDMNGIDEIAEILFDSLHHHFFLLQDNEVYEKFTDDERDEHFKSLDYAKSSNKLFTISQTILFLIRMRESVERIDFLNRRDNKEVANG